MKIVLKKVLICILIVLILNNFIMTSVFAVNPPATDPQEDWLTEMLGSFVGLLTFPIRLVALGAARAINLLTASIAYIEGATDPNDPTLNTTVISPFDIFFNKVAILDVDFFNFEDIEEGSITYRFRVGIASWYYIFRLLAASILLVMLIYVGIRMAISTVATDRAMYQKMLVDWVCSLAIIFLIQYVIIFTITVSNALIKAISLAVDSKVITDTYSAIMGLAFQTFDIDSIPATVIYCMLVWQTLGLVITYFNRMLKLAFLVILSPLITLTYSIDKMGDGKAQALGAWLKEFIYTVLIQPFHCIIYMCFANVAFNILVDHATQEISRDTLATAIISIVCIMFVKTAEGLVRKIFHFEDDGSSSIGTGLAVASLALNKAQFIGKNTKSAVNGVRNIAGKASATAHGLKVGALALATTSRKKVNSDGTVEKVSFAERKEEVRTNLNNKKADKIAKKYNIKGNSASIRRRALEIKKNSGGKLTTQQALARARLETPLNEQAIQEKAKKISQDTGMSMKEAESVARLDAAKEARQKKSAIRRTVSGVSGRVHSVGRVLGQLETVKLAKKLAKTSVSAGLALSVGSGITATSGSLFTGVMGGAAMYKGSQSFFQNTSATIANDINTNLKALGCKSKGDANMAVSRLMNRFQDQEAAKNELNQIMDDIEKALEESGIDKKGVKKTQIKNIVEGGISKDPSKTQEIINYAISKATDGKVTGMENNGNLMSAVQRLADYTNESQVYQKVKSAGDIGLDPDSIVGQAIGRFHSDGNSEAVDTLSARTITDSRTATEPRDSSSTEPKIEDPKTYTEEIEDVDYLVAKLDDEDLEEYARNLQAQVIMLEDAVKNNPSDNRVQAELEDLKRRQAQIIGKALSDIRRDAENIEKALNENYEKQLTEEVKVAEREINAIKAKGKLSLEDENKIALLTTQLDRMREIKSNLIYTKQQKAAMNNQTTP